jgi:replicative DNA helicase
MIDTGLVEDVQLKLAESFLRAAARPDLRSDPAHDRRQPVANRSPEADVRRRRGDEGAWRPAYLAQLTGSGAAIIGARDFAAQIYDLALLRALVGVGRDLVEGALDTSEEVAPLAQIERAETELYKVAEEGGAEGKAKSFGDATKLALEMAERALNSGGTCRASPPASTASTPRSAGLHRSDLIIVAGRPGLGQERPGHQLRGCRCETLPARRGGRDRTEKSAGAPVALFSLEMSADQLATRILAEQSGITSENLRTGRITQHESATSPAPRPSCRACRCTSTDTPGLTIAALRTRARRLKRQKGIGMIVVDYLQLLQGTGRGNDNRVQEISEISRGLKQLAKGTRRAGDWAVAARRAGRAARGQAPAAVGSAGIGLDRAGRRHRPLHLPRGLLSEGRSSQTPRPRRSNTEQAKYEDWKRNTNRCGRAEIIVAKQRHGSTGIVRSASTAASPSYQRAAATG